MSVKLGLGRWVLLLVLAACAVSDGRGTGTGADGGIDAAPPDAAHGDSEQVTTCGNEWGGREVQLCDYACVHEPQMPISGMCPDHSRPCYTGRYCSAATTPYGAPRDCPRTFITANGTQGCCAERIVPTPLSEVPTFYACP